MNEELVDILSSRRIIVIDVNLLVIMRKTYAGTISRGPIIIVAAASLASCGQSNTYVPPPPPKVTVANPVQQEITRYLEASGNTSAVNSTNLVARVQGYVQEIRYVDGATVKQGTLLFVIEP